MKWLVLIFIPCVALAQTGQVVPTIGSTWKGSSASTPGFVSEASNNSLLTSALATKANNTCLSDTVCGWYVDTVLSGNLGISCFQYSSSLTPSAVHDYSDNYVTGVNTYTLLTGSSADSSKKVDCAYSANLSAARAAAVVFSGGVGSNANISFNFSQFDNIATSSALDTSTSCVGTSATTGNCGSVTTTAANDLIYVYICKTGTPGNSSSFVPGSGFTLGTTQYQDGCASEWEVDSGTGSITPSMTWGGSSTYIEYILAFKSATAGTAPTGLYADKMQSWSSPSNLNTNYTLQFPSTGNLLVASNSCGTIYPTAMSDSTNGSWAQAGTVSSPGGGIELAEFYVVNAAANSTNAISITNFAGTGDCTYTFYSYQNAATASYLSHTTYSGAGTSSSTMPDPTLAPGNFGAPYNGASIFTGGQQDNTSIAMPTPGGCNFDAGTSGGENLSGPWPLWQNNAWGHCYFTTSPAAWTVTTTSSATTNDWGMDVTSFMSPTGVGVRSQGSSQGTSGSSLAITPSPAPVAGNALMVATGYYDGATLRTVSSVKCNDGATTAFTAVPSAVSAGVASTLPGSEIFVLLSAPSGCTVVTVTYSNTITNAEIMYWELVKANGGTWAVDNSNTGGNVHSGTVSGSTATGPSITTTGTPSFCGAHVTVSGSVTANPKAGSVFVYPGVIFSDTNDAATSLLTTTNSSKTPTWTDSGGTFNSTMACIK